MNNLKNKYSSIYMKWLLFGSSGWIGTQVANILLCQQEEVIHAISRADDEINVDKELLEINPDRVISLIGRTYGSGFNTIDYLEQKDKLMENIRDNLYAPMILAILCNKYNIHLTYLGTGCIFSGLGENDTGYDEFAKPDFFGSSYSVVKGFTGRLMHMYPVLNVRIRMPITADNNPRNFITKILNYKKICSIPNSMTVLPELLPIMIDMAKNEVTGTINLTNPGLISHNEILEMVKEIINPQLTWENFSIEEQDKILLAKRSNNLLCTKKLEMMYPQVKNIKDSVRNIIMEMKVSY
jgi:3,5-epimerase/4-reductase